MRGWDGSSPRRGVTSVYRPPYFRLFVNLFYWTGALVPATLAENIDLQIGRFLLSVLLYEDTIYISDNEGLSVINAPNCWIAEINPAQKKARILKKNGFSFQEKILFYQKNNLFQSRARIWSDWVILWEYFAGKGNTKALSLLRHLATQGIENSVTKCNRE